MSRYIRTTDRILDAEAHHYLNARTISKHIVKEADTIGELCDVFMVEFIHGEHLTFPDFYLLQRHYKLHGQDYRRVAGRYGAIWVAGKGLIYVAKMNNKGKLELI